MKHGRLKPGTINIDCKNTSLDQIILQISSFGQDKKKERGYVLETRNFSNGVVLEPPAYNRSEVYRAIRNSVPPERAGDVINYFEDHYASNVFGEELPLEAISNVVGNVFPGSFGKTKARK